MCGRDVSSQDTDRILGCGGSDSFLFSINYTECGRDVSSQDTDRILGCGGSDSFLFSINCTECARPSCAESPIGPAQFARTADKYV